ncbi:MAG: hypothetical protein KBC15_02475 [Candidatus Levybacteria bacterium]|nr:hypothetical protein [Candidatus Levybacteria bacterium]
MSWIKDYERSVQKQEQREAEAEVVLVRRQAEMEELRRKEEDQRRLDAELVERRRENERRDKVILETKGKYLEAVLLLEDTGAMTLLSDIRDEYWNGGEISTSEAYVLPRVSHYGYSYDDLNTAPRALLKGEFHKVVAEPDFEEVVDSDCIPFHIYNKQVGISKRESNVRTHIGLVYSFDNDKLFLRSNIANAYRDFFTMNNADSWEDAHVKNVVRQMPYGSVEQLFNSARKKFDSGNRFGFDIGTGEDTNIEYQSQAQMGDFFAADTLMRRALGFTPGQYDPNPKSTFLEDQRRAKANSRWYKK